MFLLIHKRKSLRFKGWSRKAYAAFYSVGAHVTIGNLKTVIADTFLGKQKNTFALGLEPEMEQKEICDEPSDPPDVLQQLLLKLIPVLPKRVQYKKEHVNFCIIFYAWLIAFFAVGHFLF